MGCLTGEVQTQGLYTYMLELAARLRRVRVCCGDWKRVLTPSVTTYIGKTAVFLDPPYDHELRERCYSEDHNVSGDVREWAIANGDNPDFRIALCGYDGEHAMPGSWDCVAWKAHGGYSRSERGIKNRAKERIWFSPNCLKPEQAALL
jgi:DNA adenine methylase